MRIVWTGLGASPKRGYGRVRDKLGVALAGAGLELSDHARPDWDLRVIVATPRAWLLPRDGTARDLVFHTMLETDALPDWWPPILNRTAGVWVPSRWCAEVFRASGVTVPIAVSGYGVDPEEYPELPRPAYDGYTFLAMGRLFGCRKGLLTALKTFLRLAPSMPDARLILKTSGNLPWRTITGPAGAERVQIVNEELETPELAALFGRADCFVYPTQGEGFGLEPLEAMATGLPAIVTDWSGVQEYLSPDVALPLRVTGLAPFPHPPYADWGRMAVVDEDDLADKMRWCYEHRAAAADIGKRAAAAVREYWTWERAGRDGRAALEFLLGGWKNGRFD